MATAFKYNVGKEIKLSNGEVGKILHAKKHAYDVQTPDGVDVVWGFDIIDSKAGTLMQKNKKSS